MQFRCIHLKTLLLSVSILSAMYSSSQKIGVFDGQNDVGKILHRGNGNYNSSSGEYLVSGSGTNIWFTHDDFHYVWKKMKGDFILQARGKLIGKGVEQHRKFGWMVRTTQQDDAAHIGVKRQSPSQGPV